MTGTPGPLDGLSVVEVGTGRAGSFAAVILADLGADVVKVEGPEPDHDRDHDQAAFDRVALDRGKRSVAVDLAHPAGREVLARLLARADVLIDELGPARRAELGIEPSPDAGPDLVHCSISPFGPAPGASTPVVDPASEDLIVQALSGNMDLTGEAGGPPFELGIPLGDLAAGIYAALGVLGAVAGGCRCRVEVAKLDAAVALLSYMGVGFFADGESPTRVGTGHSTIFPYNAFRARDGEVVVAPFTGRFWRNFAAATGQDHLTDGGTYRGFADRLRAKDVLLAIFEPVLARRTVAEWLEIFAKADVPAGPVLSVGEALALPHTVERGMTPTFTAADGTSTPTAGSPFRFRFSDGTRFAPVAARPPEHGEERRVGAS